MGQSWPKKWKNSGSAKNQADKQASENIIFLPRAKSQIIVISVSGGTPKPQATGSSPVAPAKKSRA